MVNTGRIPSKYVSALLDPLSVGGVRWSACGEASMNEVCQRGAQIRNVNHGVLECAGSSVVKNLYVQKRVGDFSSAHSIMKPWDIVCQVAYSVATASICSRMCINETGPKPGQSERKAQRNYELAARRYAMVEYQYSPNSVPFACASVRQNFKNLNNPVKS